MLENSSWLRKSSSLLEDLAAIVSKPKVGESCCGFDRGMGTKEWEETNDKEAKEAEDGGKKD